MFVVFQSLKRTAELRLKKNNNTHTIVFGLWTTSFLSTNSLVSSTFLYLLKKSMGQQWLDKYWFRVCVSGKNLSWRAQPCLFCRGKSNFLKPISAWLIETATLHYCCITTGRPALEFSLSSTRSHSISKDVLIIHYRLALGANLLHVIKNYIIISKPITEKQFQFSFGLDLLYLFL